MTIFPAFYIIAYDLHEPDKNYQGVEALKGTDSLRSR